MNTGSQVAPVYLVREFPFFPQHLEGKVPASGGYCPSTSPINQYTGRCSKTMSKEILGRLKNLDAVKQRTAAAVLGALVADAACEFCMPCQGSSVMNQELTTSMD